MVTFMNTEDACMPACQNVIQVLSRALSLTNLYIVSKSSRRLDGMHYANAAQSGTTVGNREPAAKLLGKVLDTATMGNLSA